MFKIPFWLQKNTKGGSASSEKENRIKLLIGLGNPGEKYQNTFHNVGFIYIDYLAKQRNAQFKKYRDFEYFKSGGLIAIKPLSFMNESGSPILKALKYFNVQPEEIVVIHDDSDLELGSYKISFNRGSAGHKGIESLIRCLKTRAFSRIRIGIRRRTPVRIEASEFVLNKVGKKDLNALKELFSEIETSNLHT